MSTLPPEPDSSSYHYEVISSPPPMNSTQHEAEVVDKKRPTMLLQNIRDPKDLHLIPATDGSRLDEVKAINVENFGGGGGREVEARVILIQTHSVASSLQYKLSTLFDLFTYYNFKYGGDSGEAPSLHITTANKAQNSEQQYEQPDHDHDETRDADPHQKDVEEEDQGPPTEASSASRCSAGEHFDDRFDLDNGEQEHESQSTPNDSDGCESGQPRERDSEMELLTDDGYPVDSLVKLLSTTHIVSEFYVELHALVFNGDIVRPKSWTMRQHDKMKFIEDCVKKYYEIPKDYPEHEYFDHLSLAVKGARERIRKSIQKNPHVRDRMFAKPEPNATPKKRTANPVEEANDVDADVPVPDWVHEVKDDKEQLQFIMESLFSTYHGSLPVDSCRTVDRILSLPDDATSVQHLVFSEVYGTVVGKTPPAQDPDHQLLVSPGGGPVFCPECRPPVPMKKSELAAHLASAAHISKLVAKFKHRRAKGTRNSIDGVYERVLVGVCRDVRFPLAANQLECLASRLNLPFASLLDFMERLVPPPDQRHTGSLHIGLNRDEDGNERQFCSLEECVGEFGGVVDRQDRESNEKFLYERNKHAVSEKHVRSLLRMMGVDEEVVAREAQPATPVRNQAPPTPPPPPPTTGTAEAKRGRGRPRKNCEQRPAKKLRFSQEPQSSTSSSQSQSSQSRRGSSGAVDMKCPYITKLRRQSTSSVSAIDYDTNEEEEAHQKTGVRKGAARGRPATRRDREFESDSDSD